MLNASAGGSRRRTFSGRVTDTTISKPAPARGHGAIGRSGLLPITLLDLVLFVLPMLVMGVASVLVIREFHVTFKLTPNNYLFFLGNPLSGSARAS
jgi:hypothetical protein